MAIIKAKTSEPPKRKRKSIDEKIAAVDNSARINRKVDRGYKKLESKISKAKGNPTKLAKIDKEYGYNYEAAKKAGLKPDSTGHWSSFNPNSGMLLKGSKHPSIIKTKKVEKILGNKLVKKDGQVYSVPGNKKQRATKTNEKIEKLMNR